ncbi:MAG: glycosyltransferase family 4 protein [Cyanobacteria bacterium]|nr:glycosyltransferase family 4 protein [Cyanobacteriota bacterium]
MKILFFAPSAYLLGGVQDWLADLVPSIRLRGHDVTVAVPDGILHRLESYSQAYPELACIGLQNPTGSQEGRIQSIVNRITSIQPDLIVGVNIASIYPAVARLRSRGDHVGKLIITLHAIEADYLEDLREFRAIVDTVVVTNKLTATLVAQESLIPNDRILYAPYGVRMPTINFPVPTSDDVLRIAWVGRFEQAQKRVHDIVPILNRLDRISFPYCLSMAGVGPEALSIQEQLQPWIRSGKVRWLGLLDRHQLQLQVYVQSDVLLITSSWETGPIVAWEAMAAGLVVVSSRYVGSGSEGALKDGHTALLFPVGDYDAAAEALAKLFDLNLRTSLANAAFEMVSRRYSDAASLASWLEVFNQTMDLPPLIVDHAKFAQFADTAPSGRLDRWLGVTRAEYLRRFLGLNFHHLSAGSEWPHSMHGAGDNGRLLSMATRIEAHA